MTQSVHQGRLEAQEMKGQCKDVRPKRKLQTPLIYSSEEDADIDEHVADEEDARVCENGHNCF